MEKKMEAITENKHLIKLLVKTYHNIWLIHGMAVSCTHGTIAFAPVQNEFLLVAIVRKLIESLQLKRQHDFWNSLDLRWGEVLKFRSIYMHTHTHHMHTVLRDYVFELHYVMLIFLFLKWPIFCLCKLYYFSSVGCCCCCCFVWIICSTCLFTNLITTHAC